MRPEGLRRELLGLPDDRYGVAEVVQGLHGGDVDADAALAQKVPELRVPPAPLVPWHIKGDHSGPPEPL